MNSSQTFIKAGLIGLIFMLGGCSSDTKCDKDAGAHVILRGTDEYNEKIKTFKFSREDAIKIIVDHNSDGSENPLVFIGGHHMILGDEYVFTPPSKLGIPLTGHYVNGVDGSYRYVTSRVTLDCPWSSYERDDR